MAGLDVICIGAINYDYMFHCSEEDLIQKDSNVGSEHLSLSLIHIYTSSPHTMN